MSNPYEKNRSKLAKKVARALYSSMKSQGIYNAHPGFSVLKKKHWDTIAWNAAWMAAVFVDDFS